jgi:hypothetical protein
MHMRTDNQDNREYLQYVAARAVLARADELYEPYWTLSNATSDFVFQTGEIWER